MKGRYLNCLLSLLLLQVVACKNANDKDMEFVPAKKSGPEWGYIDHKGNIAINSNYNEADFFYYGLAKVRLQNNTVGYINKKGELIISSNYTDGTFFQDGLAYVTKDNSAPICIDIKGKEVFVLGNDVEEAYVFSDGLSMISKNGKFGYVDTKGQIVIEPQFEEASSFSDGLACIKSGVRYGYINKEGKIVINPQFDNCYDFHDGLAAVQSNNQWGYIDKEGKYVVNPQFSVASDFHNSLAKFYTVGSGWGAIDKKGSIVVNPQFELMGDFSNNGLAFVRQNGQTGYIDTKGKFVINPQFQFANNFEDGVAMYGSNNKFGLIDEKGNIIVNASYAALGSVSQISVESNYGDITPLMEDIIGDRTEMRSTWEKIFPEGVVDGNINSNIWYGEFFVKNPFNSKESIEQVLYYCFDQNLRNGYNDRAKLVAKLVGYPIKNMKKEKIELLSKKIQKSIEKNVGGTFEEMEAGHIMVDNTTVYHIITTNEFVGAIIYLSDSPAAVNFINNL